MITEAGIVHLSIVPVRAEPSDRSEQTTQLLFGEHFSILERVEKWVKVRIAHDDYEGWIDTKQYLPVGPEDFIHLEHAQLILCLDILNELVDKNGGSLWAVPGSILPFFDGMYARIGQEQFAFRGKAIQPFNLNRNELERIAILFLNAPYLWGGRTPFGIDCSGFTQILMRLFGIRLRRDAYQQAEQGTIVNFFEEAVKGDLAFFDNEEGRIVHVGVILDNNRIIHAHGKVRIDQLDHQGIYNSEYRRYSHKLRIIRRLF